MNDSMKWVTFATAPDQITAEMWSDLVRQAGVPCILRPGDTSGFMGVTAHPVRLMTLEHEKERAVEALEAQLSGGDRGLP
jgi:hypothetical protein